MQIELTAHNVLDGKKHRPIPYSIFVAQCEAVLCAQRYYLAIIPGIFGQRKSHDRSKLAPTKRKSCDKITKFDWLNELAIKTAYKSNIAYKIERRGTLDGPAALQRRISSN